MAGSGDDEQRNQREAHRGHAWTEAQCGPHQKRNRHVEQTRRPAEVGDAGVEDREAHGEQPQKQRAGFDSASPSRVSQLCRYDVRPGESHGHEDERRKHVRAKAGSPEHPVLRVAPPDQPHEACIELMRTCLKVPPIRIKTVAMNRTASFKERTGRCRTESGSTWRPPPAPARCGRFWQP